MAEPVAMETKESEIEIKDEPVEERLSPLNLDEMDSYVIKEEAPDAMSYVSEELREEDMSLPIIEDVYTLNKEMEINEADSSQVTEITEQATHKKSDEIGFTSQKAQTTTPSKDGAQLSEKPAQQSASSHATLQYTETATTQPNVLNKLTTNAQFQMNQKQNTVVSTASSVGVQTSTPNALHLAVLQQIMNMHQAGFQPQNMNVPRMRMPNVGIMQNTTNIPVNHQQMNMMQFGASRASANFAPIGTLQTRIGVPRVPMPIQRLGVPRIGMQLPSQSGVAQFGLASLQANEQEQMIREQLNILQNISAQPPGTNAQQLGIQQQALFLAQLNAFQEMCATRVGMQTEQRSAPQLALQAHGQQLRQPMDGSHMTLQQNLFNTQHQRAGGNATTPSISQSNTGPPQVGRNVSHLTTIPQLRAPQLGNMLQLRAPHLASMPRLRMPHLNPNMQQLARNVPPIPPNMQRLGIPRLPSNVPRVGVPPLTTNIQQQLNIPHITSNMPSVGGSQISNVPHVGVSQISNVPQINIPHLGKGIPQVMGNMSQLHMSQSTTNTASVPNVARNVHQLPMPRLPAPNLSRFGAPMVTANIPPLTTIPQTNSNIPRFRTPPPPRNPPKLGLQPLTTQLSMSQKGTTVPSLGVQPIATSIPQVASNIPRLGMTRQPMNIPRHSGPRPTTNVHLRMPQPAQMGMQIQRTGVPRFNATQPAHVAQLAARQHTEQIAWINRKQQVAGGQQRVTGVKQQLSGVLQQSVNTSQQSASAPQPVHGQKRIDFHLAKMPHKLSESQRQQIILKHIQRKRMRRHLALLNWWKRYERFRVVRTMFQGNRNVQIVLKMSELDGIGAVAAQLRRDPLPGALPRGRRSPAGARSNA